MNDLISFKGSDTGLRLILKDNVTTFAEIEGELRQKLPASPNFFTPGTLVTLDTCRLSLPDQLQLESLFKEYKLKLTIRNSIYHTPTTHTNINTTAKATKPTVAAFSTARNAKSSTVPPKTTSPTAKVSTPETPKVSTSLPNSSEDLVLQRTLRGGDEITHVGNIIIHGNVNPGAKVTAGGNINIYGACKGTVFAGATGNIHATITADELSPLQIRIANVIAISPENAEVPEDRSTEQASIQDGQIVFKAYHR